MNRLLAPYHLAKRGTGREAPLGNTADFAAPDFRVLGAVRTLVSSGSTSWLLFFARFFAVFANLDQRSIRGPENRIFGPKT
jgi:hypothetical protein